MESLNGATSRSPAVGQSKEWVERTNTALLALGGFLLTNGIYFALFETDIYTALVFYSFVLMVLTGVGYCYYFTTEDVEYVLKSVQYTAVSTLDSFDPFSGRSTPKQRSTSKRRRL